MGKEKKIKISIVENYMLKKHGVFNFDKAFSAILPWLNKHKYDSIEKARMEKSGSTGKGLESEWVSERKVTDYVKFHLTVKIWLRDMTEVAMEKDGKKIKAHKGRVEFIFDSVMEKNYKGRFGDQKFDSEKEFSMFLKEIYDKYVAKSKLSSFEDKLYEETFDLINLIKKNLEV